MQYTIGMSGYYSEKIHRWFPRILTIIIFLILIGNIAASQYVPDVYIPLMRGDRDAAIFFLQGMRSTRNYDNFFNRLNNISGGDLGNYVYSDVRFRGEQIRKLELVAVKYPEHRDVLFYLSKLYREQGDDKAADVYMHKAEVIDPLVGRYIKYETQPIGL